MTGLILRLANTLTTCFQQYAALLTAIRRWGRQASCHGSKAPFLHVGLDENEAHLPEIDMNSAWSVGAHGWEEVLCFQIACNLFEFLAVACEEYATSTRTVADTDYVTLYIFWAIWCPVEGLIVSAVSTGQIRQ